MTKGQVVGKFSDFSATKLDTLVAKAKANNIDFTLPKGETVVPTRLGKVTLAWEYNEQDQSLVVVCVSKPRFVSFSAVESKLKELLG